MLCLLCAGCDKKAESAASPGLARTSSVSVPSGNLTSAPSSRNSVVDVPAAVPHFRVRVSLSPAATKRLSSTSETIIVSASYYYYGWPVNAAAPGLNQVGQIDLGREQHELSRPGMAQFTGTSFHASAPGVLNGPPKVNINVYSGRKSSPDNLLDCDIFQDKIVLANKAPIKIHCKLINEQPEVGHPQ